MSFWNDLWPGHRGIDWYSSKLKKRLFDAGKPDLAELCRMMMDSDGDFSSLIIAEQILASYAKLGQEGKLEFFKMLAEDYDLDPEVVIALASDYAKNPDIHTFKALTEAAEPNRQELFRRCNLTSDGTRHLVRMREDLLGFLDAHPQLESLDIDFHHLFTSWFNRGFLVLQPVNWTSPAHILEKIIAYEAVHEIKSWDELRRRLDPVDRYCYALFHPVMEDEPLVFVEVALTSEMPGQIHEILDQDRTPLLPKQATHAVFYSISNCHRGLSGVSFGNFLIKQVASSLKSSFPSLQSFATLSPAPGFRAWMAKQPDIPYSESGQSYNGSQKDLLEQAARYFLEAKLPNGKPLDSVARFHLRNGARLERLNVAADCSPKAMEQSLGLMANYVYDLGKVEENHEDYMKNHRVICSAQIRKLLPS
ncbi:MAG: malonyl-CoA decarboxylase [Gammaproteobacteria bacterium]|nr:malonyl-CoA decarboxylase [Gammaproteobacteria bacterium]